MKQNRYSRAYTRLGAAGGISAIVSIVFAGLLNETAMGRLAGKAACSERYLSPAILKTLFHMATFLNASTKFFFLGTFPGTSVIRIRQGK